MLPPRKTLCVALFLALANRLADAFLFSTCEITACDLREKVSAIKDTVDSHAGQMVKLVDLQHMVDKMKRGMYYQQQQIESLQKKLEDAAGPIRETRDGDSDLGRASDDNSDSPPSVDEKYIAIIKRLDYEMTNLTTEVSSLWTQNSALSKELKSEKRRSQALLAKLGEDILNEDSNQITTPKFEKLVQHKNNSNENTQRNAYKDQDLMELENSLYTSQHEKARPDKKVDKKSSEQDAPPDLIILKTEQRLIDIERRLLGLNDVFNTSQLGNTIDNLTNKSEAHRYEMDTVQQQVERVTRMNIFLNNKVDFMNRCLVNLTESMARLTVAENFSKVGVLDEIKDLQEQMNAIEELKSDLVALKNGSAGRTPPGRLEAPDNDTLTSDFAESMKLKVINSVMQEMGDIFNKTFEKRDSAIGDGELKNSSSLSQSSKISGGDLISSLEWLKNLTLNREEVAKVLKDILNDGQNRSITDRMTALEGMLLTINSTAVMKFAELNKELDHILSMIVKHVAREQIKKGESTEVEEPPKVSKLIDVVEVTGDEYSTENPGRTFAKTDGDAVVASPGNDEKLLSEKDFKRRHTQSGGVKESEWIQPTKQPCHLKPPTDENVMTYFNGDIIQDFRNKIPSDQTVYFRCENIGEYKLVGDKKIRCEDGRWKMTTHIPICEKTITEDKIIEMMKNSQKKKLSCPESTGTFPHPHECSMYLNCINWQVEVNRCMPPFKFNVEKGICDWESSVDCSARDHPMNIDKNFAKIEPSILIHPEPGSAGVTISQSSQLYVYPGTSFELHCLFPKKYGLPNWVAQVELNPMSNDRIDYSTYWVERNGNVDESLEYALRVDFSQEKDSGNYTCILPSGAAKTIEVVVKAIDCPELKLEKQEGLKAIGHVTNKMSATVTFSCENNFELIGPSFIECMPTGQWSGKQPKCIASENVTCHGNSCSIQAQATHLTTTMEPEPNFGVPLGCLQPYMIGREPLQISPDKTWYTVGEIATFRCPAGFELSGEVRNLMCEADLTWNARKMPKCNKIEK